MMRLSFIENYLQTAGEPESPKALGLTAAKLASASYKSTVFDPHIK